MAGNTFTDKQLMTIELLSQGELQKDIEKKVDISHNTIWNWKKNPQFMDAVVEAARERLRGTLPDVYETLSKKAKSGSHQHIRILLDHLEKLVEERSRYAHTAITFTWETDE